MITGVPCENRCGENTVALPPSLARTLTMNGHRVIVQKGLGEKAGFFDDDYKKSGAEIVNSAEEVYSQSDIIVKINPPLMDECDLLKKNQIIFGFFNYSDKNHLMDAVIANKITTISYSRIKTKEGVYPFVKASSEITGKTVIRIAADIAEKYCGGALLSGATGVAPMKITIIGAGTVGFNAAKTAVAVGADVSVLDNNPISLRNIENLPGRKIKTYFSNKDNLEKLLPDTDILICAVKMKNKKPIVTAENVSLLKKGAIIIDTGIASGNIAVETLDRVLLGENHVYEDNGIFYYCYPDISSLAAKTISSAIAGTLENYLVSVVSNGDIIDALKENRDMISGVLTYNGNITDEETAELFGEHVYELSMLTGF